ncbi:hypothetical protein TNCV_5023721 [Trichonephila clavipes]|nr:hypothetical protein TNCV_5023721 [Trichonephila clavipes]
MHITEQLQRNSTFNEVGKETCASGKQSTWKQTIGATEQFTFYNKEERKNDNFSPSMNWEPNTNESIPPLPGVFRVGDRGS